MAVHFPRHHDDEWVDEVRITTVPRWKSSDLSGDEWRTSAQVTILRKGVVMRSRNYHSISDALRFLGSIVGFAPADYESDEPGRDAGLTEDDRCFQPGCPEPWTVEMNKTKRGCREGHVENIPQDWSQHHVRWCDLHTRRGDCGLDDADDIYEVVGRR